MYRSSTRVAMVIVSLSWACGGATGTAGGGGSGATGGDNGGASGAGGSAGGSAGGTMGGAGGTSGDETAPTPGGAGAITTSNATTSTVHVSWGAASDDTSSSGALLYRIYFSPSGPLSTVDEVLTNGTPYGGWSEGLTAQTVEGLSLGTEYTFNVLVRDEASNLAAYQTSTASTQDGSWESFGPLDDKNSDLYYSYIDVSSGGDVTVSWHHSDDTIRFTTLPVGGTAWTTPQGFVEMGEYALDIAYGFLDQLSGLFSTDNGDETATFTWAEWYDAARHDQEVVTIPYVALGGPCSCVAPNGDLLITWLEGTDEDTMGAWARHYDRGTQSWGDPILFSPSADLTLASLAMVCAATGDHLALFASDEGTYTLNARIFDGDSATFLTPLEPITTHDFQGEFAAAITPERVVVVAQETYDDSGTATTTLVTRAFAGTSWSTITPSPFTSTTDSVNQLRLAAAGGDVHLLYADGDSLSTHRLAVGSQTWGPVLNLGSSSLLNAVIRGNARGAAVIGWSTSSTAIRARVFDPATQTWGTEQIVKDTPGIWQSGTLDVGLDLQGRLVFAWTELVAPDTFISIHGRLFR